MVPISFILKLTPDWVKKKINAAIKMEENKP